MAKPPTYGPKEEAAEKKAGKSESAKVEALEEGRDEKHANTHSNFAAEIAKKPSGSGFGS